MSTKGFIVLALWVVALVLFSLVGIDLVTTDDFNLVAIGLAFLTGGFIVNTFMP